MIGKNDRILIALSGGPDSVFLLHFLHKYRRRFGISIALYHLNHSLRGKESDSDQDFCRKLAAKYNVKLFSDKKNVKLYANRNGISVEEAGRIIRYKALESVAGKSGYNKIATAHILGDNTETVLLNLVKGSGLQGISGIPPVRGNIIRPILPLSKQEILRYLENNRIAFRTDASNFSSEYQRNFIRNELLPMIKKNINPSVDVALLRSSEYFRSAFSLLKAAYSEVVKDVIERDKDRIIIKTNALQQRSSDERDMIIKMILNEFYDIEATSSDILSVSSLIISAAGKSRHLSSGMSAIRERDRIIILEGKKSSEKLIRSVFFDADEKVSIGNFILTIESLPVNSYSPAPDSMTEYIDASAVKGKFEMRVWKNGDRFIPLGMKGSKKVSDFLTESKAGVISRKDQLVLLNGGKIVWVAGLRLDDRFKITKNTKRIFRLCLRMKNQ